jgi:hypothetical protein
MLFSDDRLDVFVQSTDNTVLYKWRDDNRWKHSTTRWWSLGDPVSGDSPYAVA